VPRAACRQVGDELQFIQKLHLIRVLINLQQRDIPWYLNCGQIAGRFPVKFQRLIRYPFSSIDPWHSLEKTTCAYDEVNGVNSRLIAQFFALSLLHQLFESLCFMNHR
jgi:hypothetical protein